MLLRLRCGSCIRSTLRLWKHVRPPAGFMQSYRPAWATLCVSIAHVSICIDQCSTFLELRHIFYSKKNPVAQKMSHCSTIQHCLLASLSITESVQPVQPWDFHLRPVQILHFSFFFILYRCSSPQRLVHHFILLSYMFRALKFWRQARVTFPSAPHIFGYQSFVRNSRVLYFHWLLD